MSALSPSTHSSREPLQCLYQAFLKIKTVDVGKGSDEEVVAKISKLYYYVKLALLSDQSIMREREELMASIEALNALNENLVSEIQASKKELNFRIRSWENVKPPSQSEVIMEGKNLSDSQKKEELKSAKVFLEARSESFASSRSLLRSFDRVCSTGSNHFGKL
mmetsp:Transcript_5967/g.7268  ORF Transcript_5967/g.7268 Transcript_5967/m.7268 type:complete len:164 (+) Transcript_5967:39-530(+)